MVIEENELVDDLICARTMVYIDKKIIIIFKR